MGDDFWAKYVRINIEPMSQIIDNYNDNLRRYYNTIFEAIYSNTDDNFRKLQEYINVKIEFYRRFADSEIQFLASAFLSQSVALEEAANLIARTRYGNNTVTTNRMKLDIQRVALDVRHTMTKFIESHLDSVNELISRMKDGITTKVQIQKGEALTELEKNGEDFKVSMDNFKISLKEELDSVVRRVVNHGEGFVTLKNFTDHILRGRWVEQFRRMLSRLKDAETLFFKRLIDLQDVETTAFQNPDIAGRLGYANLRSITLLNYFYILVDNIIQNRGVPVEEN